MKPFEEDLLGRAHKSFSKSFKMVGCLIWIFVNLGSRSDTRLTDEDIDRIIAKEEAAAELQSRCELKTLFLYLNCG